MNAMKCFVVNEMQVATGRCMCSAAGAESNRHGCIGTCEAQ